MQRIQLTLFKVIATITLVAIWAIALFFSFLRPTIIQYRNCSYIGVKVQLEESLIGLNGINSYDTASSELVWNEINEVMVNYLEDESIILGNEYQAYVVLDKTELRDVSSGSERLLSEAEVKSVLEEVCVGKASYFDTVEVPEFALGIISDVFSVDVTGKYEGSIALERHPAYPVAKTNLNEVWNRDEIIPWINVIECLIFVVIYGVVVSIALWKTKNVKRTVIIMLVVLACMICLSTAVLNRFH